MNLRPTQAEPNFLCISSSKSPIIIETYQLHSIDYVGIKRTAQLAEQIQLMSEATIQLVEYRNAVYQGGFARGRREGKGILIADSGEIFVGTWKNDCLNDKALIWLNQRKYVIGDFNRGLMDGSFVYRDGRSLFYAQFTNNKLTGRMVYLDESDREWRARCLEYRNLNYNVIDQKTYSPGEEKRIFREFLGYENMDLPDLKQFLRNEMLKDGSYVQAILPLGHTYVGFNLGDTVEKVGFCISRDELVSYGVYIHKQLDGVGVRIENSIKFEGMFRGDQLNGLGLKHNLQQNKFTFGSYDKGLLKELNDISDSEMDHAPNISAIKRDMHMKSLYFFNSFVNSSSMLKFTGYEETQFRSTNRQKDYLLPETNKPLNKSQIRPQQEYPILKKLQSERAPREEPLQEPLSASYKRLGPSKLQSSGMQQMTSKRKLFDDDEAVDINPERDFRGANRALNRLQESIVKSTSQRERSNEDYYRSTGRYRQL